MHIARRYRPRLIALAPLIAACRASSGEVGPTTTDPVALSPASVIGDSSQGPDPRIIALTKDILSCPYEKRAFNRCAPLDAFARNMDSYLGSEDGDKAIIDMITGSDEKLAVIGAHRDPSDRPLTDKARIAKLFDAAEHANAPYEVERALVGWLARVDMDGLGFANRLEAVAKNPTTTVREAFASGILVSHSEKTASFALVSTLLADTDVEVASRAAAGLARVATPTSKSCELIRDAIQQEGPRADQIAEKIASAACDGVSDQVIKYVGKRTSDGTRSPKAAGSQLTDAVWVACRNQYASETAKRTAYAIGLNMTKEPELRESAVEILASCDPKRAPGDLERLTHDDDELVQNVARRRIDDLKARAK